MFIRKKTKVDPASKKEYHTYQLVKSVRTPKGPRQQILLSVGHNAALSDKERKLLANRIEELYAGFENIITPYPDHIESLAQIFSKQLINKASQNIPCNIPKSDHTQDFERVDVNSFIHGHCRTVGLEHICLKTVQKLKLDRKMQELGFTRREIDLAIGVIIGRLVKPASERSTYFWLQNHTALDELMGTDFSHLSLNQLYKIGDRLLRKKPELEDHLAAVEEDLFSLDNTVVLYDITNTYFEGSAAGTKKARRGRSKEKRSDCPLISLGLVLNREGFPLKSHIYEGNISEPNTLQKIIEELCESRHKQSVIVLDAGFASNDNLQWLREQKQPYIVCSRKRSDPPPNFKSVYDFSQEKGKNVVKATLVKKHDESGVVELFCHSTAREEKENAIKNLFQLRFEEALDKLNQGLTKKGCTKQYKKVVEKIGRLKQQYSRVSRFYQIDVAKEENGPRATTVSYTCDIQSMANSYSGLYCLQCWGLEWNAERLWKTYIMLTKVEEGFRCLKSELGLRPIFHQIDSRIDAHLFISLLGYHIMQSILYQLNQKGIEIRWQTLRDIMATHTRVTTSFNNDKGQVIHVRSSTVAEPLQKKIYGALNLSSRPGRRTKTVV